MNHIDKTRTLVLFVCLAAFFSCESGSNRIGPQQAASAQPPVVSGRAPDGMAVFRKYCVLCHGADGKLGLNGAKDLSKSALPLEERIKVVTNGRKLMTPFGEILSPEEIQAVAAYTLTLQQK